MSITIGSTAPRLAADAYVRGQERRCIDIEEFRGTWTVIAVAARTSDLRELAALEPAFEADRAVVLATTPADYHDAASHLANERAIRFPVLTDVEETRRLTLIVDPGGVLRWAGLRRTAREALEMLEALITEGAALGRDLRAAA